VAHAYNPSYSGGRDQEGLVPSQLWEIVCKSLSLKNPAKKGWWSGMAQGVGSEFKLQY
jgi:hypothetical protein